MKFVVIGGDAAGMSAASRAKRNMPDLEVTVLEKTGDVSYSACGMPYNIADPKRSMEDLVVRGAGVFREKQGIDLRTGHLVEEVDREAGTVSGTIAEGGRFVIPYDRLLLATGASAIRPEVPGGDDPGVLVLKSLEDGRRIKAFLEAHNVRKAVILGMGYIALEMAEALRALGLSVAMVKPGGDLLPWMHRDLAKRVRKTLDAQGVEVHAGHRIQAIERVGETLGVACAGCELQADMVLSAIGVRPCSEVARAAGLSLGPQGAISVDRRLLTSDEAVFAAGDCADAYHVVTGEKVWIPLALRANRAGWAVADNLTGTPVELQGVAGTAVFQVFDLQVARTGLGFEEAVKAGFAPVEVVIESRSRAHAHPGASTISVAMLGDRESGRLLGVQMVGTEGVAHRIDAPAVALHAEMTVAAFAEADLAYAPPFSPVWDPLLTAANQLQKKMGATP